MLTTPPARETRRERSTPMPRRADAGGERWPERWAAHAASARPVLQRAARHAQPRAITVWAGGCAALMSSIVLARCGRQETGSPYAPFNAVSHWRYGREAFRRNAPTWRYTGLGLLVHGLSSGWWGWVYERLLGAERRRLAPSQAVAGAAVVTAVAAVVDLKLVPERLTPGFERRLSTPALVATYVAFGVGLAVGGWVAIRRHRDRD